jgi:DnaJ-class molecular chaperone
MNMRDPYQVLGVSRTASPEEIKKAYHTLAKTHHPDLKPGDAKHEERFKEISTAYSLLSDADKRGRYDRGEIDATGAERGPRGFHGGNGGGFQNGGRGRGFPRDEPEDGSFTFSEDFFSDIFGRRRAPSGNAGPGFKAKGTDIAYSVNVSFVEAAQGTKRRISLSNGKSLEVAIPPGTEDQQKLRLKGQGLPGLGGGAAGDAIIEVLVEAHAFFTRQDSDIHVEVPVTLYEAVLGASIRVPTVGGAVTLKIPPGSNTGSVLRLRGRGLISQKTKQTGDQYVKLKVVLPDPPDSELARLIEVWAKNRSYDVRKKAGLE